MQTQMEYIFKQLLVDFYGLNRASVKQSSKRRYVMVISFKRQPHKIVKHIQTIRRQLHEHVYELISNI